MLTGKSWGEEKLGGSQKNSQLVTHSYWNCYSSNTNAVTVGCFFLLPPNFSSPQLQLMSLYKILASLAVTSSSAGRVLSRVRIIKNRLRTSMVDDWFSALTILATESDIMDTISIDDIVNNFAQCSQRLREHLM